MMNQTFLKGKIKNIRRLRLWSALLLFLCIGANPLIGAGYDYTPAIIQIDKNQPDSVGFNIVPELTALFYKKIQEGSLTLWDSPAKKLQIGKVALEMIEQKNGVRFADNEDLFVYEFWKLYKREFEFQIIGFSFFRRLPDGRKLNFGYVEAEEVRSILELIIPTNANGQTNLTYWSALMSKSYNFNLVKFGNRDFSANPSASFNLKDQVFGNSKITSNVYKIEKVKEVEYSIYPGYDPSNNNYWIAQTLDNYFLENRHEYFNLALEPTVSYLNKNAELKVTKIVVTDLWRKSSSGKISYQPLRVRIFINHKPIRWLTMDNLEEMGLMVQFKPLSEMLREKDFEFTIVRVNNDNIPGFQSKTIFEAIHKADWNKITYFAPN